MLSHGEIVLNYDPKSLETMHSTNTWDRGRGWIGMETGTPGSNKELMCFVGIEEEVVRGSPCGEVSYLERNGRGVRSWDNQEYIVSVFEENITSTTGVKVRSVDNESRGANKRTLDDTG